MIVEYIRYTIPSGSHAAFLAAYREAAVALRGSPHWRGHELTQCVEAPDSFILRIVWDSLDGHLQGFRRSPAFPGFFACVKPFLAEIQEMRHYARTDIVAEPAA